MSTSNSLKLKDLNNGFVPYNMKLFTSQDINRCTAKLKQTLIHLVWPEGELNIFGLTYFKESSEIHTHNYDFLEAYLALNL